MAAGKSVRTWPLTITRPKPLLPVMGTPLLAHQLRALKGIADETVIIVGYLGDMIREQFGDSFEGMPLRYVEQREQLGTGHAILQAEAAIRGPFLALNGDDLYAPSDLEALAARPDVALAREVSQPERFGVFEIDGGNRVLKLEEKPERPRSNLANVGAYSFTPGIFDLLRGLRPSPRGEIEVTDALQQMAERGALHVLHAGGYYLSIGYPWHLLEANTYWLNHFLDDRRLGEVSPLAVIEGRVHIGKGTLVRPGVVIEGPVYIGDNCSVGPNCWIRPYTTLGDGCRVGQASEIKSSIFFEGASAPHQNYVGDSILGAHANLGCGTNTANLRHDQQDIKTFVKGEFVETGRRKLGAVIGDHVHTGINTAIYPGRKIWPNMVTLPGSVVRFDIME